MFKIEDGREHFYQWDRDRRVIVESERVAEVHFSNAIISESYVVKTYKEDGIVYADVPNIILQFDWPVSIYSCGSGCTDYEDSFDVISRSKPSDYVYTETEIFDYAVLEKRMETLEEELKNIELTPGEKGDKGEPGYTPVKGVDYFDGEQGIPGAPGKDGYTPVKGTDYWTSADKEEMVNEVLAALPTYEGEVEQL